MNTHIDLSALGWAAPYTSAFAALKHPALIPGRVATAHRDRITVLTAGGPRDVSFSPVHDPLPIVGDWVAVELVAGASMPRLAAVLPRRTALTRRAAGRSTRAQVVAANVDVVFIAMSANRDFNLARAERYLVAIRSGGAEPVLLLTKADLAPDGGHAHAAMLRRIAGDTTVVLTSAHWNMGLEDLDSWLAPGRTLALVGSSGTGKSTLVNALLGAARQHTGAARAGDDRGRHTTTRRDLIVIGDGRGVLIDTPGMRELGLWEGEGVAAVFADILTLAEGCRFRDCGHRTEPGCAVLEAVDTGGLDGRRLRSFSKLEREAARVAQKVAERDRRDARRSGRRSPGRRDRKLGARLGGRR